MVQHFKRHRSRTVHIFNKLDVDQYVSKGNDSYTQLLLFIYGLMYL